MDLEIPRRGKVSEERTAHIKLIVLIIKSVLCPSKSSQLGSCETISSEEKKLIIAF